MNFCEYGIIRTSGILCGRFGLLCLLAVFNLTQGFAQSEDDFEIEEDVNSNTAYITKYTGTATDIVIPEKIRGYTITGIGLAGPVFFSFDETKSGFTERRKFRMIFDTDGYYEYIGVFEGKGITSVTFPKTINHIGGGAFHNNKLTQVVLPENNTDYLLDIGADAFSDNQITNIKFSDSLDSKTEIIIGYRAFAWNNLTEVIIPEHISFVDNEVFLYNQITNYQILGQEMNIYEMPRISKYAFANNPAGKDVIIPVAMYAGQNLNFFVIPDDVTAICRSAFASNKLTDIVIPLSVKVIEEGAFTSNQLTFIKLENGIETIGDRAFENNRLNSLTIPAGVKSIGEYAFYDNKLENVILSSKLIRIGNTAFGTNRLTKIIIPNSVICIDSGAFSKNRITVINIPNSVKEIGYVAFSGNPIVKIKIGKNVDIKNNSFEYSFDKAYQDNKKISGTYQIKNNRWRYSPK